MNACPNSNALAFDLTHNLNNMTLQDILNKIISMHNGQMPNTTIFRVGNDTISLNFTKTSGSSQENIVLSKEKEPISSEKNEKKMELENSDSIVRYVSEKDDNTKQCLGLSNNFPNLCKCETYPSNVKVLRSEQRHFSLDSGKQPIDKIINENNEIEYNEQRYKEKKNFLKKSLSEKTLHENNTNDPLTNVESMRRKSRKGSNEIDFSLSFSKDSFSLRRESSKLNMMKEFSLNYQKETSLYLNMNKTLSFNKYYQSSDENNESKKIINILPIEQESFNTMDYNISKTDSKSGSPVKKIYPNEPLLIDNFISVENQADFQGNLLKNMKSGDKSEQIIPEMDLEKLELSKSVYMGNSNSLENQMASTIQPIKPCLNDEFYLNNRYTLDKKNSENNFQITNNENQDENRLENINNLSNDTFDIFKEEKQLLLKIESSFLRTNSQGNDFFKEDLMKQVIASLKKVHQSLSTKVIDLNVKMEELNHLEQNLKEKEKKLNELLEKTSKSSTHWSLDSMSTTNNKDPLKELLEEQMCENSKKHGYPGISNAEIHFLFLYSSPLITYFKDSEGKIGKRPIFNEIDYQTELRTVQEILISSQREIKFMSVPASLDTLSMNLDKNPLALHFCGHGVRNNEETFGISYDQNEGDFLILEDEMGSAHFMSSKNLEKLLSKLKNPLFFVFVASCHSKIVGEVFLKAGALHVICVKREERIMDSACQIFSKAFYHACLTGKKTICQAYDIAKDQVRLSEGIPPGEENKFLLLKKEEEDIFSEHTCIGWIDGGPGTFINLNEKAEFHHLPSEIENFLGRNEIMHDLINLILNSRLVTVKGIAGIGKSSLAKETIRYIYERKHFCHGIIYINLNGCENREGVMGSLNARIFGSHQYIESQKETGGKMLQQMIEHLHDKEVLIVFDNVMDLMLANEKEKFQLFVDYLLSNCNEIKILITSRTQLGDGPLADYAEKIINLGPLSDEDSKNLLLLRAPRTIDNEEIQELLNMDLELEYDLSIEKKKEFVGHAFFDLFGGHPQAITLAASLLDEKRLKEVFVHLKQNSVIYSHNYGSDITERDKRSFNSLKCSLDMSWELLRKKSESSSKLLSFFGLFPGGITEETLSILWGKDFQNDCEILLRHSFLRRTIKDNQINFSLFPFMTKYSEERLNYQEKKEYHEKILNYFAKSIKKFYKMIGTISKDAENTLNVFIRSELNIRACIFREISYQGNEDLEKSLYDSFNLNTSNLKINERFKDIEAIDEDDEDEFLPLTKTNIEMHNKRFDANKASYNKNTSLSGNSLRSSSPIYITESMANQLKTPRAKFDNNSLWQSDTFVFKSFNFNVLSQSGGASASLETNNHTEFQENITRYSVTPEPDIGRYPSKTMSNFCSNEVSINTEDLLKIEKNIFNPKETPKFNKDCTSSETNGEQNQKNEELKYKIKKNVRIVAEGLNEPHIVKFSAENPGKVSQINQNSFNTSQELFPNYKKGHSYENPHYLKRSGNLKKINSNSLPLTSRMLAINKLILYYSTILFILRRYNESIKMLKYGLKIAESNNDYLAKANYYRIFGVVAHLKKHYGKSLDYFTKAKNFYQNVGCALGEGICEAAIGYIKFTNNSDPLKVKEHLEKALKIYQYLEHSFGIYFLNRWLANIKQKIPHLKSQAKIHSQELSKIKDIKKDEYLISSHKGGLFVLRWMGDPISLFLEIPLKILNIPKNFKENKQSINKEVNDLSNRFGLEVESSVDLDNNSPGNDSSIKTPNCVKDTLNYSSAQNIDYFNNFPEGSFLKPQTISINTKKPPQIPKKSSSKQQK